MSLLEEYKEFDDWWNTLTEEERLNWLDNGAESFTVYLLVEIDKTLKVLEELAKNLESGED